MGLLSILPASLAVLETWLTRLFLLAAALLIGPWAALIVYDLALYFVRTLTYEIPVIGGRARGKTRPRAPSLTERPSGRPRRFSLARGPEEGGVGSGRRGDGVGAGVRERGVGRERERERERE